MLKITVQVDGMMCGMCEAHVNDAVRKAFPVKKVTSSHSKGGLFYYFEKEQVRRLLCGMAERFPGGMITFFRRDIIKALISS